MFAVPILRPFNCGCVAGAVSPAPISRVAGDTDTFDGSLLTRVSVRPPAGAGEGSVMESPMDWPRPSPMLDGTTIAPRFTTVMLAVVSASAGRRLAWTTAVAADAPAVTGTLALVALAAKLTVAGTLAADGLLEL